MTFQRSFVVENLSALVSGLLASGHYTIPGIEGSDWPRLIEYDAGKNWKEDGYQRRLQRRVIDDAETLLDDIIKLADQRDEWERIRRHGQ